MGAATLWVAADGYMNATIHQASTVGAEDLHYRNARPAWPTAAPRQGRSRVGRWDDQLLNIFPCHIKVAKGWRTVANLTARYSDLCGYMNNPE
jgi:hypothetical protein